MYLLQSIELVKIECAYDVFFLLDDIIQAKSLCCPTARRTE